MNKTSNFKIFYSIYMSDFSLTWYCLFFEGFESKGHGRADGKSMVLEKFLSLKINFKNISLADFVSQTFLHKSLSCTNFTDFFL